MRRNPLLAIAGMLLLLSACATTTETHSTWQTKTGESHPTFRHFYVLVLADDPALTSARLFLSRGIGQIIRNGLALMGVVALTEMQ
mgnify:CR=1 FL=1